VTTSSTRASSQVGSDFADLTQLIKQEGLLDRRHGYYVVRIVANLLALAGGVVAFVAIGDSWWQLLLAAYFAIVFTQLSFVGHDAGHKQIFRARKHNDKVGYFHGALVGLSYGMWINQHNAHHANPNHETEDPDVHISALAFTVEQGRMKRGVLRWMAKYQAFLFFPLLLLEGISLHVSSVQAVVKNEVKARKFETAMLILHGAVYLTGVFLVLSPGYAVAFILVHQALWGVYMGCSFAPNHKGMPTLPPGHSLDFMRKQVLTSRNVRGGWFVNWALGGLNYQIEHHLFPNMPSPNLRRAQEIVQEFCMHRGVDYAECGWLRSYGYVLEHLHAVGAPLRARG
jgi:fatty acid desaturase